MQMGRIKQGDIFADDAAFFSENQFWKTLQRGLDIAIDSVGNAAGLPGDDLPEADPENASAAAKPARILFICPLR